MILLWNDQEQGMCGLKWGGAGGGAGEESLKKKKLFFLEMLTEQEQKQKNCFSFELYTTQLVQCHNLRAERLSWHTGIKDTNGRINDTNGRTLALRSHFMLFLKWVWRPWALD